MTGDGNTARQHEARRQQMLLRLLWRQPDAAGATRWWRDPPTRVERALACYRANGQALARRALGATFPTLQQLLGEESFAGLAGAFWAQQPPDCGDIAQYGAALPAFIAADRQLADEPYLADSARLDWAVHVIDTSADSVGPPQGLQRLATDDAATLRLRLQPGLTLLRSAWPVVAIWQAHRQAPQDFDAARQALAQRRGDNALVWRDGWRASVSTLDAAAAAFTQALLEQQTLAAALDGAGAAFDFERWLLQALRERWLVEVAAVAAAGASAARRAGPADPAGT